MEPELARALVGEQPQAELQGVALASEARFTARAARVLRPALDEPRSQRPEKAGRSALLHEMLGADGKELGSRPREIAGESFRCIVHEDQGEEAPEVEGWRDLCSERKRDMGRAEHVPTDGFGHRDPPLQPARPGEAVEDQ